MSRSSGFLSVRTTPLKRSLAAWLALVLSSGFVTAPDVWAATCNVNAGTGADSGNCTSSPCKTLTYALTQGICTTINMSAGTYDTGLGESFPLALKNGVKIIGSGNTTIISSPASTDVFKNAATPLNSTTQLSAVKLASAGSGSDGVSLDIKSGTAMAPQIDHVTFDSSLDVGILLDDSNGTSGGSFTSLISNNTFSCATSGFQMSDTAVVDSGMGITVSPTFDTNTFDGNGDGIALNQYKSAGGIGAGTISPQITNNTFTNKQRGIFLFPDFVGTGTGNTFAPLIDHNHITGTGVCCNNYGIEMETYQELTGAGAASFTPSITNNTISNTGNDGIYMSMYANKKGGKGTWNTTVSGNTISNSKQDGIYASQYADQSTLTSGDQSFTLTIDGNTVTDPASYGIYNSDYAYRNYGNGKWTTFITNNTVSGSGSQGIYASEYADSEHGTNGADFHMTISGNTVSNSGENDIYLSDWAYLNDNTGPVTFHSVVSNNTVSTPSPDYDAISVSIAQRNASTAGSTSFTESILANNVTDASRDGVSFYIEQLVGSQVHPTTVNATVDGNTVTGVGGNGVEALFTANSEKTYLPAYATGTVHVDANHVTTPGQDGIHVDFEAINPPSGSAFAKSWTLTANGNLVDPAAGSGLYFYLVGPGPQDSVTALLQGNSITSSAGDGVNGTFASLSSATNPSVKITDNYLHGNTGDGLHLLVNNGSPNPVLVDCNTITGNSANGVELSTARIAHAPGNRAALGRTRRGPETVTIPTPDFGGGNLASPGQNVFTGNGDASTTFDFMNHMTGLVQAQNDYWGTQNTSTIDSHISDNEEATGGDVITNNPLASPPTTTYSAVLGGPASALPGQTVTYTAVLTGTGDCGQAAVVFTAGPPDCGGTIVPGSVTTTQGAVGSPDVTVDVGFLDAGQSVTITWKVVMPDNCSSVTQNGSINGAPGGEKPTNDVVTDIQQSQEIVDTPTLGEWARILFAVLLGLVGLGLVRRRRGAKEILGIALILIAARAWGAGSGPNTRQALAGEIQSSQVQHGAASITLSDGTHLTAPEGRVKVFDERSVRQEPPTHVPGVPRAGHNRLHAENLTPGMATTVSVVRDSSGFVRRVEITIYDSMSRVQQAAKR